MQFFSRRYAFLLVLAGTALLLMGADSKVSTGVISRVTATPVLLSPYEEELAKSVKFERKVLVLVKEEVRDHVSRLVGFDEEGYRIIADGIVVSVSEDQSDHVAASLRKKLLPLKYLPFIVEMNAGLKTEKIGILNNTDQFEILRTMHTNGDAYDISNEDVIEQLKEWEKASPFDILGADNDWVELEFRKLPKDLNAFAEEVYDFCPDAVDQGPGSLEGLVKDLGRTKKLFLWWD